MSFSTSGSDALELSVGLKRVEERARDARVASTDRRDLVPAETVCRPNAREELRGEGLWAGESRNGDLRIDDEAVLAGEEDCRPGM